MNNVVKLIAQRITKCILVLLGAFFLASHVTAAAHGISHGQEQVNVIGAVRSGNEPLAGVSVSSAANPGLGVSTDDDGGYRISVNASDTLVFSFVGYAQQRIAVNGRSRVDVTLLPLDQQLEEIVVVGYGTQKRANLTGAISTIQAEDIQTTTHSSLAQKLQGKVPGLQIRQNTGGPGDFNAMINIRGFGSPLYVIDGIVRDGGSEFQRLNPEDIESISVLKDASAAVYGVNAANGVIIVTTKRGKQGKPQFQYGVVVGMQSPTDMPQIANAAQWMEMRNDAAINVGLPPYISKEELEKYQQGAPGYESTNWYDETMKPWAGQQQHTLSAQGGTESVNYFSSFGFVRDGGLLKSEAIGYDRYTFRTNLTAKLTNELTASVELAGRYDRKDGAGYSIFDILRGTISALPTNKPYLNGNTDYPTHITDGQSSNPVAIADPNISGYTQDVDKQFQSAVTLTYKVPFLEGLQLKGVASYDGNNYLNKALSKSYKLYSYDAAADQYNAATLRHPTVLGNGYSDMNRVSVQVQALYNTVLADSHNIGATLVYEERNGWTRSSGLSREFQFFTNDQIDMGDQNNQRTSGMESQWGNRSFIGRLTYDYVGKYLLEVAARYDGSYRYHPDRRWGLFPVVSAGWRVSEERFFKDNVSFISNLKLRGSYGLVGEDAGNPFQYVPGFSTSGGGGYEFSNGAYVSGVAAPGIVNQELTWFQSKIADIGVDLGLFDGRLNLEFDVYQRDRTGLLAVRNVSLPNTFGGSLPQENLNSDRVRGIEFAAGYSQAIGDFRFDIGGNFNFARTMNVYVERGPFVNSMDRWRNGQANRWSDVVWMYDKIGQFQSEDELLGAPIQNGELGNSREMIGDFRYRDANGDGVIDGEDAQPLAWGGNPKMFFGLTLAANWKGFDFNMLWQGSGNYSVRFTHAYAETFWGDGNLPAYFYDRWHLSDPYDPTSEWIPGEWPATRRISDIGAMYHESSVWRRDASYVRLKNLELGYSFNQQLLQRLGLQRMRVYANGYNLLTITDPFVKAFDPEQIEGALNTGWVYPLSRSFNIGVNLTF
ncbi:SusC/RagA family TonB-linked outer membrane protein [Parapedobacter pyrenivorans]|uniref:SusC/RagA family TonB-linked outer membrane protein n=1 Tax=Parapedobacter pyrenivorans TaxID=1305674 RepID=A0A917I209_9SPHI|nr:TonB-dependent receptor [Parapedobacter pyrenivorans]GGH03714.1 SusC/RagA family TonB-linked outer membrane protein [Parapedobacter pyrenivorans]